MKKNILILLFFATISVAQNNTVPQFISYQGIARNASGTVLASTTLAARFSIFNKTTSAMVYSETYTGVTGLICNSVGIFNASIGSQNPTSFQSINWASNPYEIHVELDIANGTSFIYIGTQDFKTVPYAFHSADGVLWKGNFSSLPPTTLAGSVYRDRISGVTYYRTGSLWDTLAFTPSLALGSSSWNRNTTFGTPNVQLANPSDNVSIGLPLGTVASEKLHLHNNLGDAYMQFTTLSASNNVGLVFGSLGAISKGKLTFDNSFNELTYRIFGNRAHVIKNDRSTYIGRIPLGFFNSTALSVLDSTIVGLARPSFNVFNQTINEPVILHLGENPSNGTDLVYKKGTPNAFTIKDALSGNKFTFNSNGNFYPGSDGTPGQAFLKAGPTITDPLIIQAATSSSVVTIVGYTQLGNNGFQFPAIQVLEFTTTMVGFASSNSQISLASYIPNSSKIVSVQIFINTSSRIVPPNYTISPGYEYQYEIGTTFPTIFIWTTLTNSFNIFSQPVRVLVTIKK